MKHKTILTLAMALITAATLSACSGQPAASPSSEPVKTPAATIAAATPAGVPAGATATKAAAVSGDAQRLNDALKNLQSYKMKMTMEMKMSSAGQNVTTTSDTEGSVILTPGFKQKMQQTSSSDGQQATGLIYSELDGSDLNTYTNIGGTWQTTTVAYNGENLNQMGDAAYTSVTHTGSETIDGIACDTYTAVISAETMQSALQSALSSTGGSESASLFDNIADIPVEIALAKATGAPVRLSADMSDAMLQIFNNVMPEGMVTIDSIKYEMSQYDFNNVADFEIPAEAKAAAEQ